MAWWKGGDVPIDVWKFLDQIEVYLEKNQATFTSEQSIAEVVKAKFPCEVGSDAEKILDWIISYRFS